MVWPIIPDDVVSWFREVFACANKRVCERLANLPNIRETSLDDGLIEALVPDSAPKLLPSGAIVRMDTHNSGGLRRLGDPTRLWEGSYTRRWETADIAILVFVYRREALIAKKIGLLQSKRLYPENNDVEDSDEVSFLYGMNAFLGREGQQALGALHRTFSFVDTCAYGSLKAGDHQAKLIDDLNKDFGKAVYYLLYNPHEMPLQVEYPLTKRIHVDRASVGCRVCDADHMHRALAEIEAGHSPTFKMVTRACSESNWPLERWAADLLLTCQVGEQFDNSRDDRVRYFLERRSGPIGAALAASITLPDQP